MVDRLVGDSESACCIRRNSYRTGRRRASTNLWRRRAGKQLGRRERFWCVLRGRSDRSWFWRWRLLAGAATATRGHSCQSGRAQILEPKCDGFRK
jgi:hypothetical protein